MLPYERSASLASGRLLRYLRGCARSTSPWHCLLVASLVPVLIEG